MTSKYKSKTKSLAPLDSKGSLHLSIHVVPGDTIFSTKKVTNDTEICELKKLLELVTGIPSDIQRLSYIDGEDLIDTNDVRSYDMVTGGTIRLTVWDMWFDIIQAVAKNDFQLVFNLGITADSDYTTPNLDHIFKAQRKAQLEMRGQVALMMAAHRGHYILCEELIKLGININGTTPCGRTALHLVAARGNAEIMQLLLKNGIDINAKDSDGLTARAVAENFSQKMCARQLFTYSWGQRAKLVRPKLDIPLLDHQIFDSVLRVGWKGEACQMYRSKLMYPCEYDSTALSAKLHCPPIPGAKGRDGKTLVSFEDWMQNKEEEKARQRELEASAAARKKVNEEDSDDNIAEDERISVLQKTESFENWIKKQQQQLAFEVDPMRSSWKVDRLDTIEVFKNKGYLREYLESLLDKKRPVFLTNTWLPRRGLDMLDSVEERPAIKGARLLRA